VNIATPYLLFLGDEESSVLAKTAQGLAHWRPELCVGQWRLSREGSDLGLPELSPVAAYGAGARTLVVGVANVGGFIPEGWVSSIVQALDVGLDVAAGLHTRLVDVAEIRDAAKKNGRQLHDVRHPGRSFPVGTGERRSGKRLLTVGTDCAVGKMYAALAIEREMKARGMAADFRATGQTGILIAGRGVSVDAVVADFVSGASEWLSPANDADHWDLIEGQGSLFHPGYAGVTLGLVHGSQPDAIVVCHQAGRRTIHGVTGYSTPTLRECMERHLEAARVTNPDVLCAGVCVDTSRMVKESTREYLHEIEDMLGVPCADPLKTGVVALVDRLEAM
jgi:uncharacterized NAD-dependent epimerase/dehydratase family protein